MIEHYIDRTSEIAKLDSQSILIISDTQSNADKVKRDLGQHVDVTIYAKGILSGMLEGIRVDTIVLYKVLKSDVESEGYFMRYDNRHTGKLVFVNSWEFPYA